MGVRTNYETELQNLKGDIGLLSSMVEEGFNKAVKAIIKGNNAALEEIIERDEEINRLELEINENATIMIAKQQPVASDLRKVMAALKVASDLERMGDLTVDMAKSALRMDAGLERNQFKNQLMKLAEMTSIMMKEVLHAYKRADMLRAQKIAAMDDEVDDYYGDFLKEVIQTASGNEAEDMMQLAFIGRFIERIADYCTNVAEWIIYEVNGRRFDLN
ncbi:phosphate signaling complex protein PhoU [Salipaludibacillus sp. CUR1]|uniref:phosphate signaling complex protein PhoU n=1 Tax=Salipaludibacillus sp. CUR1 TaxID=2820003 RepID=UPI001E404823|nr:phosphate signaling complex protein PhoU [Salipaludibacillus sp. CUR1]